MAKDGCPQVWNYAVKAKYKYVSLGQAVPGSVGLVPIVPLGSSLKYAPQN